VNSHRRRATQPGSIRRAPNSSGTTALTCEGHDRRATTGFPLLAWFGIALLACRRSGASRSNVVQARHPAVQAELEQHDRRIPDPSRVDDTAELQVPLRVTFPLPALHPGPSTSLAVCVGLESVPAHPPVPALRPAPLFAGGRAFSIIRDSVKGWFTER
jgi:hypothetical protein